MEDEQIKLEEIEHEDKDGSVSLTSDSPAVQKVVRGRRPSVLKRHQNDWESPQKNNGIQRRRLYKGIDPSVEKHILDKLEKAFSCDVCDEKFAMPSHLKRHQKVHSEKRVHQCSFCEKRFIQVSHLKTHILIHTGERPHQCDVCGAAFTQSGILKTHYMTHTGERPFKCDICDAGFTTHTNLKLHRLLHAGVKRFKCEFCDEAFSRRDYFRQHVLTHIEDSNEFEECEASSSQTSDCTSDQFIYSEEIFIEEDSASDWLTEPKVSKRQKSGRPAQKRSGPKRRRLYKGIDASVEKHILEKLEKAFSCDVCEEKFSMPSHLKRHQKVHSDQRVHQCSFCEKRFNQVSHLKTHTLIHTGERPHQCDVCGAAFTQSGILKTHYMIHTGERPFKCVICEAAFTTHTNLKIHHLQHTGVKRFECEFCDETFSRRDYLRQHVLTHIEESHKSDEGEATSSQTSD